MDSEVLRTNRDTWWISRSNSLLHCYTLARNGLMYTIVHTVYTSYWPAILMSIVSLLILFGSSHITVYLSILDCTVNDTLDTRGVSDICSNVNSPPILTGSEVLALLCETFVSHSHQTLSKSIYINFWSTNCTLIHYCLIQTLDSIMWELWTPRIDVSC